ncbi:hypothetical protein B0T14DRAFT_288382 [Immersiella caudata]|uniref:VTC domain-containing protein n=1 Tax=Immersiella caudata TaxID=314043 RepID=A0AA39WEF5_9PEZI|nr:hypothetical protein B0T14DRAFT_288382 [Immersiella caudata]
MSREREKMAEPKKKGGGFWGLFRTQSSANKARKLEKDYTRRVSEGDALNRRRRPEAPPARETDPDSDRRRPRRPDPNAVKGKGREAPGGRSYEVGPLTEWPPSGMSTREELTLGPAMQLISRGVPAFKGYKRPIPHASDHYYALFATAAGNHGDETDAANQHSSMTQLMTLRLVGSWPATYPWETLEQPSFSFCFGRRPGTITLNHWASMASVVPPSISLRDPGILPREMDLEGVLERLKELERGLEDDDEDLMYKNLYRRLLRDPDKYLSPHRTLDKQITDLIMVLSRADWVDFTNPRNQVVTKFIFDTSQPNVPTFLKFFHQLLLSAELDLRINSKHHLAEAKEKLLSQIPPTIQWSMAVARRWRDNMRIEDYGASPDQLHLRLKLKKRQVKMLKRFAQMMKWPNLEATLANLKQRDTDGTLDLVSSHAMAFFSGLVLPGPTFPFLIMNSLIDIDPDKATDDLALLTHVHPHCGFQYRSSYTYWSSASIVGKVLAPTCRSVAGWVGPARPTPDLGRSQIARIRARKPPQQQRALTPEDVRSMSERSDPLGPPAQVFPVKEYTLVSPTYDLDAQDFVRMELLSLRPCANPHPSVVDSGPRWFDARLQFAIDGASWPLRLAFDVNFIHAWPCSDGPHPLFFDYIYECVRADELVGIKNWNGVYGGHPEERDARSLSPGSAGGGAGGPAGAKSTGNLGATQGSGKGAPAPGDEEKVLVVEAFGVADNEVLARAWCAHWGLSAVVADVGKTCMACAIREAYAATLTVVILVDDGQDEGRDD